MRNESIRRTTRARVMSVNLLLLLMACSSEGASPQATPGIPTRRAPVVVEPPPESVAASGVALTCEVYCSETELRTALARLSWRVVPGGAADAAEASAAERLDATVFPDGFAKGLYVSLPISATGEAVAQPADAVVRQGRARLRAFQIRIAEVEEPRSREDAPGEALEHAVVVEDLEPGMTYTWRLVLAGGAAPTVTCAAPVCPADMVRRDEEEGPQ